jgi:hypothetical protein
MDFRNIKRYFLFNRALSRYDITTIQFNTLYAVSIIGPIPFTKLHTYLTTMRRTISPVDLGKAITWLISSGYIYKESGLIFITSEGLSFLTSFECTLRSLRTDK